MTDYKTCPDCGKVKPVEEFYTRSGTPHLHLPYCKVCHRARYRSTKPLPRHVSPVEGEARLIEHLWQQGIPALPGKALSHQYADVIAWGCVMLEIKSARCIEGGYHFSFTPLQQVKGLRGHVLVLATVDDHEYRFHFFDAKAANFYRAEMELKTGVMYSPDRALAGKRANLTPAIMNAALDNFDVIETMRRVIVERLRNGGRLEFEANGRRDGVR